MIRLAGGNRSQILILFGIRRSVSGPNARAGAVSTTGIGWAGHLDPPCDLCRMPGDKT